MQMNRYIRILFQLLLCMVEGDHMIIFQLANPTHTIGLKKQRNAIKIAFHIQYFLIDTKEMKNKYFA